MDWLDWLRFEKARLNMYKPKMEPRKEQVEALARLQGKQAFALLMAMRTGKTKVALDDFGRLELAGSAQALLVIAPGGVYKTWVRAWDEHVATDLYTRAKVLVWESDERHSVNGKERLGIWQAHNGPRVLLLNVEALSRVQDARDLCIWLLRTCKTMVVVDESTCIKGYKTRRAKFVTQQLGPMAKYRRILSGLPTPRSPLDLFMQFYFLNPNIFGTRNYFNFRMRYAVVQPKMFGGRTVQVVVGYKNQHHLRELIAPYSYRVEFRAKIPSTYTIENVGLTEEQQSAYARMKQFATFEIAKERHVTATIVITQMLKLHQILCGYVKDEEGKEHTLPELRTKKLLEVLNRGGGKAVVWCSYDHTMRKLTEQLVEEYGEPAIARFWGGNERTREAEERRFMTDPDCWCMLATPNAGGKGRTWDVADLVVYYSSTNDLELRDQSEQRVQGVDKKRQVDYVDLIAPGTVEEKILQALRKKINLASIITGSDWKSWVV